MQATEIRRIVSVTLRLLVAALLMLVIDSLARSGRARFQNRRALQADFRARHRLRNLRRNSRPSDPAVARHEGSDRRQGDDGNPLLNGHANGRPDVPQGSRREDRATRVAAARSRCDHVAWRDWPKRRTDLGARSPHESPLLRDHGGRR